MSVTLFIPGTPAPGGSKTAFRHASTGKVIVKDACKRNASWRQVVAVFASQAMANRLPLTGPLVADVLFTMTRPAGHYGTGRNAGVVKATAPTHPTVKPDATKLWRSTEDALTGIVWRDDAQIVEQRVRKVYGDRPGASVVVSSLEPAVPGKGQQ